MCTLSGICRIAVGVQSATNERPLGLFVSLTCDDVVVGSCCFDIPAVRSFVSQRWIF